MKTETIDLTTAADFTNLLRRLDACDDARAWAANKTFAEVWRTCARGDWMLWLAARMMDYPGWCELRNLTMAKVKCARISQHLMKDARSLRALDVAEAFARGEATREELYASAASAAYAAAAYAAYAAAYAAAAYSAAADREKARIEVLKQCADICREILVTPLNIHQASGSSKS